MDKKNKGLNASEFESLLFETINEIMVAVLKKTNEGLELTEEMANNYIRETLEKLNMKGVDPVVTEDIAKKLGLTE